MLSRSNQ